jgi:hypothetical protein
MTRNSITGQVKALSLIIAMQNFIPDRRVVSKENKPAPTPVKAEIYKSKWLREQQAATTDPQPIPAHTQQEAQEEELPEPKPAPGPVAGARPAPVPTTFAHRVPQADGQPPYVPPSNFVPDTRVPFSIKVNPFKYRR